MYLDVRSIFRLEHSAENHQDVPSKAGLWRQISGNPGTMPLWRMEKLLSGLAQAFAQSDCAGLVFLTGHRPCRRKSSIFSPTCCELYPDFLQSLPKRLDQMTRTDPLVSSCILDSAENSKFPTSVGSNADYEARVLFCAKASPWNFSHLDQLPEGPSAEGTIRTKLRVALSDDGLLRTL